MSIEKTIQPLKTWIQAHIRNIKRGKSNTDIVIQKYFNTGNCSINNLWVVALAKVKPGEDIQRREMDYVMKYDTKENEANMW